MSQIWTVWMVCCVLRCTALWDVIWDVFLIDSLNYCSQEERAGGGGVRTMQCFFYFLIISRGRCLGPIKVKLFIFKLSPTRKVCAVLFVLLHIFTLSPIDTHTKHTKQQTTDTASGYPFYWSCLRTLQRHDAEWRDTRAGEFKTFYRICLKLLTLWFW